MSRWFRKVTADQTDFGPVAEMIDHFQAEYEAAQGDLKVRGRRIDEIAAKLPGLVEQRYAQFQELEMVQRYLEKLEERAVAEKTRWYMEHYNRALSEANARRYAENHDDVFAITLVKMELSAVRNAFMSLSKGLETLHFQIGNITKIRCAGIDDATF